MIRRFVPLLFLLVSGLLFVAPTHGQEAESLDAVINADQGETTINRHIYGHFAEHLGEDIYGGFWIQDEDGDWQYNEQVIQALREVEVPNVRWPGGCFADYYHWQDGIGPQEERPDQLNTLWGGVTEDNSFGTHEFMGLIERLDTEPIIVGNVGSGTVEEMQDWWKYLNHEGPSPMADLRAENGQEEPWGVEYFGVGNESWGCGGQMRPQYYADLYKRFAEYLRPLSGTEPFQIAAGPNGDDYEWMETLMEEAGDMIDGIDLHHYTVVGTWENKGSATDFTEAEWHEAMQEARYMDELLTRHSAIMDQYDPEKETALIVGEWGMWHDPMPDTDPGFLKQQNTLRDAIVAALHLNIFNQHAERVRMANLAQTVNVLQAMLLYEDGQLVKTPTYHVFDMYKAHQDATLLPMDLERGTYEHEGEETPAVTASASVDEEGRVHVTMANADPNAPRTMSVDLRGQDVSSVRGRVLTADEMNVHNTFEAPDRLTPSSFDGTELEGNTLTIELPAKS
ncbi:MAG: alpha-N-arabinofuranosidase, partial [Salinivenus sp.]